MSANPIVYEVGDSGSGTVTTDLESGEVRDVSIKYVVGPVDGGFNDTVELIEDYAPRWYKGDYGPLWSRKKMDVKNIGAQYWEVTSEYSTLLPALYTEEDDPEDPISGGISWDTTGNTEHITQALGTSSYGQNLEIYDAINVSGDGVAGLDVVRPALRYSETWIFPSSVAMGETFIGAVYRLTGTVNAKKFRFFDRGEALFMGARTQWSGGEPFVLVTFDFECRPNDDDAYVKGLSGIKKDGWQYLWIWYAPKVESDQLVRFPQCAFVQTVYPYEGWEDLLIGDIKRTDPTAIVRTSPQAAANAFFQNGGGNNN